MSSDSNTVRSSSSFTEDEQHVAGNAFNFFKVSQFDSCLGILKKLQKSHPSDPHILHNKVLTEFLKSGKTKVQEFRKNMLKVQRQLQQSSKDDEDGLMMNSEKTNYAALCYNQALLLFNIHQYSEAEGLLERLTENIENPDDSLLLKIHFLLVDTYLHTYKAEKASFLISAIEKILASQNEGRSSNNDERTQTMSQTELEYQKSLLGYLKNYACLQAKSLKAYKKDMKLSSNVSSSSGASQAGILGVATVFLKSNYEYARCNFHKAYRILGASSPPPSNHLATNGTHDGLSSMYYNNLALTHFNMGKYSVGSFYMQKALHENDVAVQAATKQHYMNLATVAGRHHQQISPGKPLNVLTINRRLELLYNCGLHHLYAGNASTAFDCLLAAVHGFRRNPRLWLRLAECCIQKCTLCSTEPPSKSKKSHHQNHSPFSFVGGGNHQKVVVNTSLHSNGSKGNNTVMSSPSLEFASICLKNSLVLLTIAINAANERNDVEAETSDNQDNKTTAKHSPTVACLPGAPVSGAQFDHLYTSVLINSAFVALCLGDNLIAYEYARKVLSLTAISGCHRYLAHMYAAEALVSLDRISEAIEFLSTDKVNTISLERDENGKNSPVSDETSVKSNSSVSIHNQMLSRHGSNHSAWNFPTDLSCAHGFMLVNLANAHSLRSEYDKALGLLQQAILLLGPKHVLPHTVLLAVYVNLLNGGDGLTTAIKPRNRWCVDVGAVAHLTLAKADKNCLLKHNSPTVLSTGKMLNGNGSFRSNSAGGSLPSSCGAAGDSSASSTTSSAPRSKSSTPQPSAGGVTPERVVKSKTTEKKRNRR